MQGYEEDGYERGDRQYEFTVECPDCGAQYSNMEGYSCPACGSSSQSYSGDDAAEWNRHMRRTGRG